MRIFFFIVVLVVTWGCSDQKSTDTLFTNITKAGGIDFNNTLQFTDELNPYTYRNFYNGAGVAIGDINNDGLQDIYFTGNQIDNKLYLNKGNLKFEDITEAAGVACKGVWSTGVTFVDINADGLLDIYVCKSGDPNAPHRYNELFINNGDLTFTEKAKEYGLDVIGLSVQSAFFDFDKDGDLDCYLLTNSFKSIGNFDLVKDQREIPDPQGAGNKFFINEGGKFKDYSEQAGIYRSNIGFGLGITLGDFNEDTWTDIFISNDFFERDYLYINNQHGGFIESLTEYFSSISMGSMGADYADLDGDGISELFVTEMLPDSLHRRKTKTIYENWDKHQLNVQNGYYYQFSRNVLQKKICGNKFAEVGRLAGVAASEWSWGALLFDMDSDGKRDIFIANGIYKDLLDRDYLAYTGAEDNVRKIIREEENAILKLIDLMPSSVFTNYAFKNNGDLQFENKASEWGFEETMYSSGSAYGDLDNDGDLDLVVNNINGNSVLYRNNTDTALNRSISITLKGQDQNVFAVGTQIIAHANGREFTADNFVTRGYQSSVQPRITIGLGKNADAVDSIEIFWHDGSYSSLYDIKSNQNIVIDKKVVTQKTINSTARIVNLPFLKLEKISDNIHKHQGSGLVDFNRDRLLPMMYSNESSAMLKGDIDGDGLLEIYLPGGKDQSGTFLKNQKGNFTLLASPAFNKYALAEETKGALFDADKDGDLDFYMATGGRFFSVISNAQEDKLFLNDGRGVFTEAPNALQFSTAFATSVVVPFDFDNDDDTDLMVGERFDPFFYGRGGRGYLLRNDGAGNFTDVTNDFADALAGIGMITDAVSADINQDSWMDLMIVGDWMPIVVLQNKNGRFEDVSDSMGLKDTRGWWHTIETADLNGDGKPDFLLGNHGLNSFFKRGDRMYVNDFDGNGSVEQIYCTSVGGKYYPISDKDEFLSQLPALKKSLLYYKDYGKKSVDELFPEQVIKAAKIFEVDELSSILLISGPSGYTKKTLPLEAQYAPIYSFLISDFDNDSVPDVIAGGNQHQVKPQFGRYDASHGWFFKGSLSAWQYQLGRGQCLNVEGQIRDIELIEFNGDKFILFAKYDDELEVYKVSH